MNTQSMSEQVYLYAPLILFFAAISNVEVCLAPYSFFLLAIYESALRGF